MQVARVYGVQTPSRRHHRRNRDTAHGQIDSNPPVGKMDLMNQPTSPPPNVAVFQLASSAVAAQALSVVADLGVADHVAEPAQVETLARQTGTDSDSLYRVLRFLASIGIFRELDGRRFEHTDMSRTLQSSHPSRARASVQIIAGRAFWPALGELMHSVRTGETAWDKAHGVPVFDYFQDHPEIGATFNDAMIGIHGGEPPAVAAAYPFAGTVVDVGGGSGNLLVHVLGRHPGVQGVLFDLPAVAEAGRARLAAEGLSERCRVESGSFYEAVPAGGDIYVLSHIIHDWDEASCLKILGNCRDAMKPDGRILLVEMVIPGPNEPHPGKLLDLVMLAVPGGRERTPEEYAALFAKAGLRLAQIVPTASPVSIVEARRA